MSNVQNEGIAPNAKRLLFAGFMAILAAGVGFSIRAGILGQWAEQYGFTQTELFGWYLFRGLLVYDPWPPTGGVIRPMALFIMNMMPK